MRIQNPKNALASVLLSTFLLASAASAQPAQSEPSNSPAELDRTQQKQTVRTYDKFPDPSGDEQDLDAEDYETPSDGGEKNYIRFDEQNDANDGERYNPTITVVEDDDEEDKH